MIVAPRPHDESERLAALRHFEIIGTPPEEAFDRYTRLAAKILDVPIAVISLVEEDCQWFKSHLGIEANRFPREWAFCAHAILGHEALVVPDATQDRRFFDNPLVTGAPAIRFYAGVPLETRDHFNIGTLCIMDNRAHETITEFHLGILRDLAHAVVNELYLYKATLDLKQSETAKSQLAAIIESSNDAIISKTLTGIIMSWNHGAEAIFGYSAAEAINRPLMMLIPPERAHEEAEILGKIGRGEHIDHFETIRVRKDGAVIDVSVTVSPIIDRDGGIIGISKIARDISERRQTERALADRQDRLSAIFNTVVDGIITIDQDGIIETFNPAAARIFGYQPIEVIGCNVKILMPDPYHREHDDYLSRYNKGGEARVIGIGREVVGRRKDGTTFPMELSVGQMGISDRRMFTGIVRDISDRKQAEKMKTEFISTISHELRTPLTAIRGSLSLVNTGVVGDIPDDARNLTVIAEQSTDRLVRLINDILDVEKISAGQLQLDLQPIAITEQVARAVEDNQAYGEQFGVGLGLESGGTEAMVLADADRIVQIFTNLISNAVKFSPRDQTVSLSVTEPRRGWVRVSVADRGPGIPSEFRSRIFGKFAQADSSDSKAKGGTGLGLNITRNLVERMHGRIWYESEIGQGTVFHVEFPLLARTPLEDKRPAVLIVAGDPALAGTVSTMLDEEGFAAVVAATAAEGQKRLCERNFVAVCLDLGLSDGDGDGPSLLRELPCRADTRDLPVIAISAVVDEAKARLAEGSGEIFDWIGKPVDAAQFLASVRRASKQERQRVRILHVEDDDLTRALVARLLADHADVIGATSVKEALDLAGRQHFDMVVLDIGLPDGSGAEVISYLNGRGGGAPPMVVFSAVDDLTAPIRASVEACLVKSRDSERELVETIRKLIFQRSGKDSGPGKSAR